MGTVKIILGFIFLFLFSLAPAHAQENWDITNYHTDLVIEKTGEVFVTEAINVNFGTQKHGIYRDISYEYQQESGDTYYTEINVTQVLQDGTPAEYKLTQENSYLRIRIGDPDVTISGTHDYKISYRVTGVIIGYEEFDELYWNAVGNNWAVPVYKATARVTLPENGIVSSACFVGTFGSTETCEVRELSGREIEFSSPRALLPYEGFSVVVGFSKDMVPTLVAQRPKTLFERFFEWPSLATLFSIILFGFITTIFLWHKHGRDFWHGPGLNKLNEAGSVKPMGAHETVVVEYEPPENLRPAEIGVLVDETAHTHDVTSTIVDLATRGFLSISEIEKKWKLGASDFTFTKKNKDTKNLREYEKLLLSHLFKSGTEVKMSSLKQTFYDELAEVKSKLYEEIVRRGFFLKNPEKTRNTYLGFAILGIVSAVVFIIVGLNTQVVYAIDVGLGLLATSIVVLIFSRFMPRRTAKGRELYRRAKGYRLFISTAETHRQRFFEKKNMFNEVLPYAMVFELTNKYIKALSDLGIEKQTSSWYHGHSAFTMGNFASSMNSFSSSVSTAMASTPKSSGSSGGGSSGGGFGGGGGGSW